MTFNPKEHMTSLKGKDYLEVKWRLLWFREEHPNGTVATELLGTDPLIIKAVITADGGAILATAHGTAQARQGAVWSGREIEKAETAAIGRALGHAGYGTQFTAEDEGNHLADSPVERKKAPANPPPRSNGQQSAPAANGASGKQTPEQFVAALWDANKSYFKNKPHFDSWANKHADEIMSMTPEQASALISWRNWYYDRDTVAQFYSDVEAQLNMSYKEITEALENVAGKKIKVIAADWYSNDERRDLQYALASVLAWKGDYDEKTIRAEAKRAGVGDWAETACSIADAYNQRTAQPADAFAEV